MLNEPTLDKLKHLGLYAMATARGVESLTGINEALGICRRG